MRVGNRILINSPQVFVNELQLDQTNFNKKLKTKKFKENQLARQNLIEKPKRIIRHNFSELNSEMTVEGWGTNADEDDHSNNILQQKYLNFDENHTNARHCSKFKNRSMIEVQNEGRNTWGKSVTKNQQGYSKKQKYGKNCANRLCERKKKQKINKEEFNDQIWPQVFTEGQNIEDKCLIYDDFQISNIDILKTRAKRLESEEFFREVNSNYKSRENQQKEQSIDPQVKKIKNQNYEYQLLKGNLFITSGNQSVKNSTNNRCKSLNPENHRNTFYNMKLGNNSNAFHVYKKAEEELIRRTVYDSLKISSKNQSNALNSQKIQQFVKIIQPIHNNNISKIPFQKFFNRKRNKCNKMKESNKLERAKTMNQQDTKMQMQRIEGTKLNRIISHNKRVSITQNNQLGVTS